MPKYLATLVCVIDANDDDTAWDVAEQMADGLDSDVAWAESIHETDEFDEFDDEFNDEENEEDE